MCNNIQNEKLIFFKNKKIKKILEISIFFFWKKTLKKNIQIQKNTGKQYFFENSCSIFTYCDSIRSDSSLLRVFAMSFFDLAIFAWTGVRAWSIAFSSSMERFLMIKSRICCWLRGPGPSYDRPLQAWYLPSARSKQLLLVQSISTIPPSVP